jgi:hypothetical protein
MSAFFSRLRNTNHERQASPLDNYLAGMMVTVITAPGIAIAVTLVVYVGWLPSGSALLVGVLGGILGWLSLAFFAQRFVVIDRANPKVYQELRSRAEALQTYMQELARKEDKLSDVEQYALAEARRYLNPIQEVLQLGEGQHK